MPALDPAVVEARAKITEAEKTLEVFKGDLGPLAGELAELERTFVAQRMKLRLAADDAGLKALVAKRIELREQVAAIKEDIGHAEGELGDARLVLRRLENAEQIKRDVRKVRAYGAKVAKLGDLIEREIVPAWREVWAARDELEITWPGNRGRIFGQPPYIEGGLIIPSDLKKAVAAALYRAMGKPFIGGKHPVWSATKTYKLGDEIIHGDGDAAEKGAPIYRYIAEAPSKGINPLDSRYWQATGASTYEGQAPNFPGAEPRNTTRTDPKQSPTLREASEHAVAYLCAMIEGKPWPPKEKQNG